MRGRIVLWIVMLCGVTAKKKSVVINYTSGVEVCKDEDSQNYLDTDELRASRINETTSVLEGGLSFKMGLDGLVKLSVVLEKVSASGSSETIATYTVKDFCMEFKKRNENTLCGPYLRHINVPDCPIPPGDYRIENMMADMRALPKELILPGTYRITVTYLSYEIVGRGLLQSTKDTRLGCLSFECAVETV